MKALTASLVVLVLGCGPATQRARQSDLPPGTVTITAEQIEKSGARTAWQVLKTRAPMFQTSEDRNGRPSKISRRGRASFLLDESPTILVDGVRVPDFRALRRHRCPIHRHDLHLWRHRGDHLLRDEFRDRRDRDQDQGRS